jgi:ribose transport system permease protein
MRDTSVIAIVGLAQLCVLSLGHLNLAVGRMAAVGAMAAGFCYEVLQAPLWLGLLAGLATGALIGAITGLIIVASGVNSFVVTLAMDFALLGFVSFIYMTFTDASAYTVQPEGMDLLRQGSFADLCIAGVCGSPVIPLMILPTLIALGVVGFVFNYSRTGRELLATGSNLKAAQLSGIPVNKRIVLAHSLSGLLAGLGGVMLGFVNGSFSAAIGDEFLLPSFLAPVLGGTALTGGAVAVFGTFLGALLTLLIRQGLVVQGIGLETLNITLGIILLLALSLGQIRKRSFALKSRHFNKFKRGEKL